ncbi:hypothetical protein COL922a_013379 [Colletotrichum nupharicola]|nr:hypothetical protein COL922a_013379 [Colletotrichum nupharicola]
MQNPSFILKDIKKVVIKDRPKPQLKDGHDVLVHVSQTSICGSDVHYWQWGWISEYVVKGPMVLGHESSGVVVEVGEHITHLKPGDRVAMEPSVPCRRYSYCHNSSYFICPNIIFAATPPINGTLAKYYINASDFCYKVPDSVSMEEAAMVEPLSVALCVKGLIRYKAGSYPAAIELLSGGKIDVKRLVTHRYKFEQAEEAFELVKAGRPDVFKVSRGGPRMGLQW